MLVVKKLFSGNYLKKLHYIPYDNLKKTETNEIPQENNNIIMKEEKSDKFYLISIYESSIDINLCEYDTIIKQYVQTPILHQNLFFIIFDSSIIDDKIILLTSIGLLIYQLEENKLKMIYNDIFNTKCEPKDLLMYLKINKEAKIIAVYSNINLFFLYHYSKDLKNFLKVNQINKLSNGFIKNLNIFNVKEDQNYFILSIQTQIFGNFGVENYIYKYEIDKNNSSELKIKEIDAKNLNEENNIEKIIGQNIKYMNKIFENINNNYNKDDKYKIKDIIFDVYGKYIFLIKENGYTILKRIKKEGEELDTFDFMFKFEFKYGTKVKKSYFIDYKKENNFHFLFFDNKVSIFDEKEKVLARLKLKPKDKKKLLTNSNAIIQNISDKREISLIMYNYKNDISFITVSKEEIDLTENKTFDENKYQIKVITRSNNESMFCLDGAVIANNKDTYKIFGICGLKGESRLIKYSNLFNEINLFNKDIDNTISSISIITDNFKNNYFSNLLMTSNNIKSNLYILNKSFILTHIKEFSSNILKIYPVLNSLNIFTLVFKGGIGQIIFEDINSSTNFKLNNIYELENNENNNTSILFSYNFIYNQINYVVIYLSNKHMICFKINDLSIVFDVELNNFPQLSSLGVIVIENLKKFGFIFGNYMNNHITTIYYDIEGNKFDMENVSETKIYDSQGKYLLVPEEILVYNYYIFMTTHTGDFITLLFNDKNIFKSVDVIFNLENITKNQLPLKFSQIEFNSISNEFDIDFYSMKNAYNIKLNIIKNNNNEIQCNSSKLTRYNFNQKLDSPLLSFKKIYSENKNNTNVYFYLHKGSINFSYYHKNNNEYGLLNKSNEHTLNQIIGCPDQIQKNNILIEVIYKFPENEKAIKIITLNETNDELLVLTNNSKLYLFNEELKLKQIKNISEEVNWPDLVINGVKNYIIKEDDQGNETNLNMIIAFGNVKSGSYDKKGVLVIYQYINDYENDNLSIIKPIRVVHGYPNDIEDAAIIKKYIICSIEAALCVKEYNIKDNEFLWKTDAQAKIVNYMNNSISLVPLNKFCNNYYLMTGDIYESFHLIKFSSINPANYEALGADLSLNALSNIYPINENSNEVFITDKKGIITKFSLNDEIYDVKNRVDLKEYISKLYVNNNKTIMIGLLGSLYYAEILGNNINNDDYEKKLMKFQKDVFNEVSNINLGKIVDYEESMMMSEKINNVLLIDNLINFCGIYYKELSTKIQDFTSNVKFLKMINDDLILKNE